MFEHLDDPVPFRTDARVRRAVTARGRQLRLRRRLATTLGGLGLLLGTIGATGALYVERRDAAIDRIDVATAPSTDGAMNILLVGADQTAAHPDSIVVVRLSPDGSIGVLSVPRDLVDPATGVRVTGHTDPQALVDAVVGLLGVPIDHYVRMDFGGFVDLVDQLGGLPVAIDRPLHDPSVGLDLEPTACTTLDGETTLALVRARHLEWDGSGDLGRIARGQALLTAAVAQLAGTGGDPASIDRFSRLLADHAVVDAGLDLREMIDIGRRLAATDPSALDPTTLPVIGVEARTRNGAEELWLAPEAAGVLLRFGASPDHQIAVPPSTAATSANIGELIDAIPAVIHPC
jgi:LCP family protein required for cell wall assembly